MMKMLIGIALGLAIGAACRWFEIPIPAPPTLMGVVLIFSMTLGYQLVDGLVKGREAAPQPAAQVVEVQSAAGE